VGAFDGALVANCGGVVSKIALETGTVSPLLDYSSILDSYGSAFSVMLSDETFIASVHDYVVPTLVRFTSDAEVLWTLPISPPSDGRAVYMRGAVLLEDGTIVITGLGRPERGVADAGWVLQLDATDGSILHNVLDPGLPLFTGLALSASGSLLAVGNMRLSDGGLIASIQSDMSVVPLYSLSTSGVDTGFVGSGARLRALVNPLPRSFTRRPYVASVAVDETGASDVWQVDLVGGVLRPFEPGIVVMGEDPETERGVLRRVDSDTMATVWEVDTNTRDVILGSDGFLYVVGSGGQISRMVW